MSKTAFDRYAPFIREYIYRKNWTDLKEVQVEACEAILDTDNHVIIASGTASGKTEAAFFPILTDLFLKPAGSVGVMYIGPLKALINDQFERLSGLLEDSDIPVRPWHGDVGQAIKKDALKRSQGVLQITPESLEALIMTRPGDVACLFADLRFIVIDEIHALTGTDRGLQTMCLLSRLEKLSGCNPRRIGLSATLNSYEPVMRFLSANSSRATVAVGIKTHKRTVSLCAECFVLPEEPDRQEAVTSAYNEFIYENCRDKKCLIFTNSRKSAEEVIADMKRIAETRRENDIFYVHHGAVSADLRHVAESALKAGAGPTVAAATLTLELGIDIGDLDSTIQLGAPYSCASFVQRLGRSGRRSGKSRMMFALLIKQKKRNRDRDREQDRVCDRDCDRDRDPFDSLPLELLRVIAIIQLYLEERWVEPFVLKPKPFSLLAHQTLGALMTYGELSPAELAKKVLLLPAFRETVSQDEYRVLLRHMLSKDYLERMESGGIIVGLKGEKIAGHYSSYAVFSDEQAYVVRAAEGEIGLLNGAPTVGGVFVLAGRSWEALSVDDNGKTVFVRQIKKAAIQNWQGSGGHVHTRIAQRMRQVLSESVRYAYLRENAVMELERARAYAKETGLADAAAIPDDDGKSLYLCPWVGDKILRTIEALFLRGLKKHLQIRSVDVGQTYLRVSTDLPFDEFCDKITSLGVDCDDPRAVLSDERAPRTDKYDYMVPDELLRVAYLKNELDVPGAVEVLKKIGTQSLKEYKGRHRTNA